MESMLAREEKSLAFAAVCGISSVCEPNDK
jgi:hypothetical protein